MSLRTVGRARYLAMCAVVLGCVLPRAAHGQDPAAFGVCVPQSQRAGRDVGCFILTEQPLGTLDPARTFWHVTRFPSHAAAERESAGATQATVIDAFGTAWLVTIADSSWRPRAGRRVAIIGPLPVVSGTPYNAVYMEASMRPGMKSTIHRHPGPEAWYTMQGETCLETPNGTQVGRPGNPPVIVPGGQPMELTATGTAVRQSLVLILHDSSQPAALMDSTWKPRGLCRVSKRRRH